VRVDWAIQCRYAEADGGIATIVGAGIDTYFVQEFPAELTLVVAVRLAGADEEMVEEHDMSFRVHDPDMEITDGIRGEFRAERNPLAQAGWEAGLLFVTAHQIAAPSPGAYGLEILIDDESKHTVHFFVREPPTESGAIEEERS
jgi:hypothetical protein